MSDLQQDTAVVGNNTALRTAYTVAQEAVKAAKIASKAADSEYEKAAKAADKAQAALTTKSVASNKAAFETASKAAEDAKAAKAAKVKEAKEAAEVLKAAEEAAEVAYNAIKAAEEAAKAAKAEEAAKAAKKEAEEAEHAPMVLSNDESKALDAIKQEADSFSEKAIASAQLDADSIVILASLKSKVQTAFQDYKKVKSWDIGAIAKVQDCFPYILTAESADKAIEAFCQHVTGKGSSWVNERIRMIDFPVIMRNVTGRTMGLAVKMASTFILVTESMWKLAVSENGQLVIGPTKIDSHAGLWQEYCKAAEEHYSGLAIDAGAKAETMFRVAKYNAKAEEFGQWAQGLANGTMLVENGVIKTLEEKAAEEAAKAAKIEEAAKEKAAKEKAAKAAKEKAAKEKAAEEAAKAAKQEAEEAAKAAEEAAKAAEEAAKTDNSEEAAKAAKAAEEANAKAEEANAKAAKAAKAAEDAKAANPVILVTELISDHKSIEKYQIDRITEYAALDNDELTNVMMQIFEQLHHADRIDVVSYAAVALHVSQNRQ